MADAPAKKIAKELKKATTTTIGTLGLRVVGGKLPGAIGMRRTIPADREELQLGSLPAQVPITRHLAKPGATS